MTPNKPMTAPADLTAETLVGSLTNLAATAHAIADGLEDPDADHVRHLADVANQRARLVAIENMQREELEAKLADQDRLISELLQLTFSPDNAYVSGG